jgi:hypothetical protein
MPERVQLKRVRGWRLPPGCKCVTRASRWGNPWVVIQHPVTQTWYTSRRYLAPGRKQYLGKWMTSPVYPAIRAVDMFRRWATWRAARDPKWLEPLRGCDLACSCPPGEVCHADVLLELANREPQ